MEIKDVHLWKPISFSENWEGCSTSRLDVLLPSWLRKRETLKEDSNEYAVFMDRLKRQHAIETGIVEKLYDLSEGVTETFIKEGFVESYLQHGDTNILPGQLMAYLQDNFEALDFAFEVVKNNRPISTGFIKELHQLITRHQDTAEGRDQFGNRLQIPLLKGTFKERENNPTRADGTRFIYCPPIHVGAEMDKLVAIYAELEAKNIKPVVIAAWLHHAFVAIHPFQDGNGRVARLLASLVLVKHGLFPLTVKRNDKKRYIDALELADRDKPQALVDFFGETQIRNIEAALNLKIEVEPSSTSLSEMLEVFSQKLEVEKGRKNQEESRLKNLRASKQLITQYCHKILEEIKIEIERKVNGNAKVGLSRLPENDKDPQFAVLIAKEFGYHHNVNLQETLFSLKIDLVNSKKYNLIISLHHYGFDDSTLAIGAVLISNSSNKKRSFADLDSNQAISPLPLEPFTISLESDKSVLISAIEEISVYLKNVMTLTLAQIASEMQ